MLNDFNILFFSVFVVNNEILESLFKMILGCGLKVKTIDLKFSVLEILKTLLINF